MTKQTKLIIAWKRIIDALYESDKENPISDAVNTAVMPFIDHDEYVTNPYGEPRPKQMHITVDLQALSNMLGDECIEFLASNQTEHV